MQWDEIERKRILQGVQQWFRRRKILGSTAKGFEVAALIADSEANGLAGLASVAAEFKGRIARFRKLAKQFRKDAVEARIAERTL